MDNFLTLFLAASNDLRNFLLSSSIFLLAFLINLFNFSGNVPPYLVNKLRTTYGE
jgi:hypothetical protein